MRNFALKTKSGETINQITAYDYLTAVTIFAEYKLISNFDLLEIYDVIEE